MNKLSQSLVALGLVSALGIGAAVHDRYRDLRGTRDEAAAAWRAIGDIHAERARMAQATLGAADRAGMRGSGEVEQARAMLSQVGAMPAGPALLDDPRAIDTYKRYQGELTGALFMLAFGARTASGAATVAPLRDALLRHEAALAQARQRYRQAARRHNADAASLPGTLVAALTGQGPVPPEL
jgi:LemA protein